SQTSAGSIREDRLVLPIPPGTHWRDVLPMVLPTAGVLPEAERESRACLPGMKNKDTGEAPVPRAPTRRYVRFGPPSAKPEPAVVKVKPKRQKKEKIKNDPKFVAAARELRDRWLERVNADPAALGLGESSGKYDISRDRVLVSIPAPGQPHSRAPTVIPSVLARNLHDR